jgi:lysophospholipase L1-like esterase
VGSVLKLDTPCDHVGMSGWTTRQMLSSLHAKDAADSCGMHHAGLARLLKLRRYSLVVLMAGTNDLGVSSGAEIAARLVELHESCHTAGVNTIAIGIPESKAACKGPAFVGERRREANELLAEFAALTSSRCAYVSMDAAVPWTTGSALWESDGLHMSREGYARFAEALAPKLREVTAAWAAAE